MLRAFIKYAGDRVVRDTSPEALSGALREKDATFWLDMVKPTDEEYALLDEVFGFHPLAIEDTLNYISARRSRATATPATPAPRAISTWSSTARTWRPSGSGYGRRS